MDSLLANYGSDDDGDNSPPGSPKPTVLKTSVAPAPIWNRQSLFGVLPPPRNSASGSASLWDDEEEPVKPLRKSSGDNNPELTAPLKTSFFTSLPPPKNSALEASSLWDDEEEALKRPKSDADRGSDPQQTGSAKSLFTSLPPPKVENVLGEPLKGSARTPKLEPVGDEKAEKRQKGAATSALLSPKLESVTLPEGFFDNSSSLSDATPINNDTAEGKPALSFERLPLPASSKPSFARLPPPSTTKRKQVVEFKPPINYGLLETTEEDDESERSKKQSKVSKESDGAPEPKVGVGLVALLPRPKNSLGAGAALGGGNSHGGRRTVMETAYDSYRMADEVTSTSGSVPQTVKKSEPNVERPPIGVANYGYEIEPAVQSSESYYYPQPDGGRYDPHLAQQPLYAPSHSESDGYSVRNGYAEQSWQNKEVNAFGVSQGQGNAPVHVLAEVMKKERRKGRDEPPPQMIEVKQADLTGGSKMREDQMRSTGIAFGPTYKPVASNKDKPSKIHRRKHQIGALYFDMKQNEMNLLDRRAKGNLTKAETQAKYGW